MVHENMKNMMLEVPPDDTTLTMWDVITIRVQWGRTSIDVDPSATASASTTASQPHTAPGSLFPKTQPHSSILDQLCSSPPRTQSVTSLVLL
jgi:hypothetical protein